jgi:hypothetical protein
VGIEVAAVSVRINTKGFFGFYEAVAGIVICRLLILNHWCFQIEKRIAL